MTRREFGIAVAVLAAAIALIPLLGGSVLWTRPFWLDERCCTLFNVSEATNPVQVVRNVFGGDVAPPGLHLIVWSVTRVIGMQTAAVRSIAVVAMCAAFLFVYAALRRRFSPSASAGGVIALATHALIVEHTFEIRFYGLWVCFAAAYAWSLGIDATVTRSRRRDVAIAVASILVCTIHWFGVISLGLMAVASAATRGRDWRSGLRLVAPSAAGLLVLLICSPMLFMQLRAGGSSLYWIPPLSWTQVKQMAWLFLVSVPVILSAVVVLGDRFRPVPQAPVRALLDPALIALSALVLVPVALIAISAVMKPVVWPRYAIVAVLAWAPIVALGLEALGRVARGAALVLFVVIAWLKVDREIRGKEFFSTVIGAYASQLEVAKQSGFPIVFQNYFLMYPVDGASRRHSVTRFLDLPDSTIESLDEMPDWQKKLLYRDRNMVRVHEGLFGFPVPLPLATLEKAPRFYLFTSDDALPAGYQNSIAFGQKVFPQYQGVRVSGLVTLFQRVK